ncbi:MAG: hypothetical protein ABI398_08880 [Devosia sp.]
MSSENSNHNLADLIAASDGSPRSRMTIACHALSMALEARRPHLSEAEWKEAVSTYLDDVLRMGVTFDMVIDGMRPPNTHAARLAELAPIIEALSENVEALMLDPSTELSDLRRLIEGAVNDPSVQEAQDILRRRDTPPN